MSGSAVLCVERLKGQGVIRAAAKHNKRELQGELGAGGSIDATRCHLNECLTGHATADEVADRARALMDGAGVGKLRKMRKDTVRAIECVVSLALGTCVDERAFFADAARWLADRFGGEVNILSADVHRDEPKTHLHLLMLPLVDGHMAGSRLFGGKLEKTELQADFHAEVCARYGMTRPPPKLAGAAKHAAAAAVLHDFQRRADPCMKSPAWSLMSDAIKANPGPYLAALGLEVPAVTKAKKLRSMTDIFISKGKGSSKPEPDINTMGFAKRAPVPVRKQTGPATPGAQRNPSCVGFTSTTALLPVPPAPAIKAAVEAAPTSALARSTPAPAPARHAAEPDTLPDASPTPCASMTAHRGRTDEATSPLDTVRERDADFAAGTWNADTGEFQPARVKAQSNKASARDWVAQALREVTAARGGGGSPGANRHPSNGA